MKWNIKNLPRKEKLKLIELAEREIEEWEKFLSELKKSSVDKSFDKTIK